MKGTNRKTVDFSTIEWETVDKDKAEFFYREATAKLNSIHKNIDSITNKAIGMLSFSLPVLTALTGYFVLQWGALSVPLIAASVCSTALLFAILVLLLFILLPMGLNSAQAGPKAYFQEGYYARSMEDIIKGNIQTLSRYIDEDMAVLYLRGNLFRMVIALAAAFPVIVCTVWAIVSVCTG